MITISRLLRVAESSIGNFKDEAFYKKATLRD